MSEEVNSKRRKMESKNYYKNQKKSKSMMEPGQVGFLATCNFREKECVREAYNLLNEYADQEQVQEQNEAAIACEKSPTKDTPGSSDTVVGAKVHDDNDDDDDDEEEDIATTLEKQIKTMTKAKKFDHSRFQQIDSKMPNCIFIKTNVKDPNELGVRLVRDIAATKTQKTRYLLRLWPVDAICRANNQDILNAAGRLFDKVLLKSEPTTYSVVVNKRHNTTFDRMKIIQEIAELIDFKCPAHKVDLKNPKITIAIEIMKGLCCISLLPDYFKLKKYNVYELAQPEKPAEEKTVEEKPIEEKPAEEKPIEEKPAEEKPTEEKPSEEKPIEEEAKGSLVEVKGEEKQTE
ncbi:THUMP domain-containing protein 1 homolog [Contarinia nasturtii]|uniref:THUMP domain-containing protein 1 homolog n=1 Tax=Contarinia nasturtii TaxID=265458 RepID=UPI0012D470FF|nr:THUMP domain-containing protein 1 homolog [Contarinia nasturtii]